MVDDADQGGETPCWAHLIDELDSHAEVRAEPPLVVRSNTILYCDRWSETVDFYRHGIGLSSTMERDWFVEFEIHHGSHVSVADAARATISAGDGSGLTLSWCVDGIEAARSGLAARGVEVSAVGTRWGADFFHVVDPDGNRIEFWSATPEGGATPDPNR